MGNMRTLWCSLLLLSLSWAYTGAWRLHSGAFRGRQHEVHRQVRSSGRPTRMWTKRLRTSSRVPVSPTMMAESDEEAVTDGDIVVVAGASGRIGRLVTESLAGTGRYKVRGLVRNLKKAKEAFDGTDGVELAEGNIQDEKSLGAAMKNAACVVACTGTTAFPSARWGGGNTPDAVDNLAVGNMIRAAADAANHPDGSKLKRFVLLSSVGVERKDNFPFVILNAFGVLDAKAKGEDNVRELSQTMGFSYSIVRPGQLPEREGTDNPAKSMVSLKQGDTEAGSVSLGSVAATFLQAVRQPGAAGKSYTVVDVKGAEPTQDDWDRLFAEL